VRCTPSEVHAHEVHAHEVHAHEVHAYEIHTHEVHAYKVHAYRYTPIRYTPSKVLWWGQLVTSPLWAQELSFMHLLEIARTQTDNKEAFY
jgi:hypothetical protein